jgi:hypothetical protein
MAKGGAWAAGVVLAVALACAGKSEQAGGGQDGGGLVSASGASGSDDGGTTADAGGTTDGGLAGAGAGDGGAGDGGAVSATDGGSSGDGGVTLAPPISVGNWTFYGAQQGLPANTYDVSPDEGGNVYVAGGDAVYAKTTAADHFTRFDAAAAGLTQNCYQGLDPFDKTNGAALSAATHPTPPGPPTLCPVISVGGMAPGQAIIGYEGYGTDGDYQADWATDAGGLDLLSFDGTKLARTRHVFVASPPGVVCGLFEQGLSGPCNPWDYFWLQGRRKLRNVYRIAVNHHAGTPQHLDVWMAGTHATFTALFNDQALARGWWGDGLIANCPNVPNVDPAVCAKYQDAKEVWEHEHPAFNATTYPDGVVKGPNFTGDTWAVAIAPSGQPWAHNTLRLAAMTGDTARLDVPGVYMDWNEVFDLWPDTPTVPNDDDVQSMSFCPDGSLWVGSINHGLALVNTTTGQISGKALPGGGQNVWALACDRDGSLWISTDWGEIVRYDTRSDTFTMAPPSLPELARHIAWDIQIDELASPRVVYFAMRPLNGQPGGVVAYSGP